MPDFATLEPQAVREYWRHETAEFTPWLADQIESAEPSELENVLGLDLEVIEREKAVGSYFVDIYGRAVEDGRTLVVENQLEPSDHDHLGKSIAYAAGLDAAIVVWVAPEFRDEHRDALQWLNVNSREGVDFFGLRLEVWRIGDSEPAVRFNPVEEPSEWRRKAQRSEGQLTENASFQEEFWTGFRDYIESISTPLRARKPRPRYHYSNPIGVGGFHLLFQIDLDADRLHLDLIVEDDELAFYELMSSREDIESEIGSSLEWGEPRETHAGNMRSNVRLSTDADLSDRDRWEEAYEWLRQAGERYHEVFPRRLQELS